MAIKQCFTIKDVHDYHFGIEGDGTLVLEINDINGCIDKDILK